MVTAWVSAGTTPFRDAAEGAFAPSDFATDFVPAVRLRRGESTRVDVRTGNAEAARWGAPAYADVGVPFGAHPPPAVLLVATLVPLGFRAAALVWLALSLACVAFLSWILTGIFAATAGRPRALVAGATLIALCAWPPVLHDIEKGQWSLVIAALLAVGWWAGARGHARWAGAAVATAGVLKVMPLLGLAALLSRPGQWRRVTAGAVAAIAIAIAASAWWGGARMWSDFLTSTPINTAGWQTGPANTLSLWGVIARLTGGGPFARPLSVSPGPTWVLGAVWIAIAAPLAGLAVAGTFVARRSSAAHSPGERQQADVAFAAWCILAVVLGPLSWSHTATWLLLPAALLARCLRHVTRTDRSIGASAGPIPLKWRGPWMVWAIALVALSIPRQTLFLLAGPLPVSPFRGLVLGTHLVGALGLLFVAFLLFARNGWLGPINRRAS